MKSLKETARYFKDMLYLLCVLVVAASAVPNIPSHEQYRGHQVFSILPKSQRDLLFLTTIYERNVLEADFWSRPTFIGQSVEVQVPPEKVTPLVAALEDQSIEYEVIHEDLEQDIINNYMANFKAKQARGSYNFEDYMDYDEMMAWLNDRNEACGESCELFSIGQSYEEEDIMVIKITDGDADGSKPALWVDGGIHAREWIAYAVACYFIDQLISDDDANILEKYDVYVLPAMNPDGYRYTFSDDRMWRKSRMPNSNSSCIGTDLNRNFDHNFGGIGTSTNPCTNTFHGGEPYSNSESGAVAAYIENNKPAGNWTSFLTLHSHGRLWMAPWGYSTERPPTAPELDRVGLCAVKAIEAVHGTVYRYGSASEILYQSSGTSRDWAYGVPKIPYVYTIELPDDSFILDPSEIIPACEETYAGFQAMVAAIDAPGMICV